ncbi:MFS transporter [Planomonospora parontospora]|uniref:MFS transporter n=1 Tax=Planomonospora parontospora TaxID=58119 RepID=UPI001984D22B|nr:MFS transporter [Planomonospora parontospora]GGL58184.1 MFS transporter [Planomonospora parontospora subsp. antibiotica]GII20121.1 MFS transporter [Planomonospora parontospora subsp. antibiotica]
MPENPDRSLAALLRHLRMDLSPLRDSREFRLLFGSGVVTMFGTFLTLVAVPLQMKELTGSPLAVGLVSAAEFVPMVVCGLWGGAIADALDRRKIILYTEAGLCLTILILLVNALLPEPQVWVLYVVGAMSAAFGSLQRPSLESLMPRVVRHDQLTAAAALSSFRWNLGAIIAPGLSGLIAASYGVAAAYAINLATFLVSLALLWLVKAPPRDEDAPAASIRSMVEGVRYAVGRPDLMGTYLVDVAAMVFAFSTALYPFLADQVGSPEALGLFYSAAAVGSLIASVTSGWTNHVHRHGLGVIVAALVWGAAVALAAVMPNMWGILAFFAVAGAADMISGVFRATIWNQTIPDSYRGRLAGIELLSYTSGPMLGNARAGLMDHLGGTRFSLGAGGLLCVGAVAALAGLLPKFRDYDARTDEHAVRERTRREELARTTKP